MYFGTSSLVELQMQPFFNCFLFLMASPCNFLFCRIIRAFLVEEQKIVKKVLKIQKAKERAASKS